jgi:threonine/homoserine/homoserine lactone efflux protein
VLSALYLLQGITFGLAAAIQPGPFQTYVITQTVQNGHRRALPLVFVPLCTNLPIVALVVLVLQRLPDAGIILLRLVGGAYMLVLAHGFLRSALRPTPADTTAKTLVFASFWQAMMVSLLNPNPYLFWGLVTGPILISGWRLSPVNAVALLAGFYLAMMLVTVAIVLAFGLVGRWNPVVRRLLIGSSAIGLAAFGAYQMIAGSLLIHWS